MTYIPSNSGGSLSSLGDIALSNLQNNETIVYNSALQVWSNAPMPQLNVSKAAIAGVGTWNGTAWSDRDGEYKFTEWYSDGTAGSVYDIAAPAPSQTNGDRWWRSAELYIARDGSWYRQSDGLVYSGSVNDTFVIGVTKPDATNTGVPAGTSLAIHSGDYTANVAGAIVQNLRIEGRLTITAADVTVKNCEIVGAAALPTTGEYNLVQITNSAAINVTVEFCTINPRAVNESTNGIRMTSAILRRCKIANVVDHISLVGSDDGSIIEGNYCDQQAYLTPCSYQGDNQTHNDIIQFHNSSGNSGGKNAIIRGNTFVAKYGSGGTHSPDGSWDHKSGTTPSGSSNASCAVFMFSPFSSAKVLGVVIEDNWLDGGFIPVNCGGASTSNLGRMWRNKFDGDSRDHDNNAGTAPLTIVKASTTIDTGDSSNINTFYAGTFSGQAIVVKN